MSNHSRHLALALAVSSLAGCSGNGIPTYTVGGTVDGLSGSGLVLQLNGEERLPISADGAFTFQEELRAYALYEVTVLSSPPSQTCTVARGSGAMPVGAVTDVLVTCRTNTYTLGGTVTGLAAGEELTLQLNGGADLLVEADGPYVFPEPLADGTAYAVTVSAGPPGFGCEVSNASGTIQGADVANVDVACVPLRSVGGTAVGLSGPGLVLQLNGGPGLAVDADGPFVFPEQLPDGASYAVTVLELPPATACELSDAAGTVDGADVTNVGVACAPLYSVGGTVTGLTGPGLVLQLNGGPGLAVDVDGPYAFPELLADGASYAVTVLEEPPDTACEVSNGAGTITGADVTDADVACAALFSVGGVVGGLGGAGLVLQLNGGDDLAVDGDGPFAFEPSLESGADYEVTVSSAPPGQACTITSGTGTVADADVTSVVATCAAEVTGLAGVSNAIPSLYNRIDASTGAATPVSNDIAYEAVAGLAYDPGSRRLFACDAATETLLVVDPLFGTATLVGAEGDLGVSDVVGLAFDAQSEVLYGVSSTPGAMTAQLVSIDVATGVATEVGLGFPIGATECLGLAFVDPGGLLYASTADSRLIVIDPATGASTGELMLSDPLDLLGLAYDAQAGQLLGTVLEQRLVTIDPDTGQVNVVDIVHGFAGVEGLAWAPDLDVLFGTDLNPGGASFLLRIDPDDASGQTVGSVGFEVTGLAEDPADGTLFGITDTSVFIRMNPNTGESRYVDRLDTPGSMSTRSLVYNPGTATLFTYAIDPAVGGEDLLIELDRDGVLVMNHGPSPTLGGDFEALAIDAAAGTMYGVLDAGGGSPCVLYSVAPDGMVTQLHELTGYDQIRSVAFDPDSAGGTPTLYSVDTLAGRLLRIDVTTGDVTEVGPTPDAQGLVWIAP